MQQLGKRLTAAALRAAPTMTRLMGSVRSVHIDGVCTRVVESMAVAASTRAVLQLGLEATAEQAGELLRQMLVGHVSDNEPEEQLLLNAILAATVRVSGTEEFDGTNVTIGQLLDRPYYSDRAEPFGIKRLDDKFVPPNRRLFIVHGEVVKKLLRGTRYENSRIDSILLRLPGAERKQLWIAGHRASGVVIPFPLESHEQEEMPPDDLDAGGWDEEATDTPPPG